MEGSFPHMEYVDSNGQEISIGSIRDKYNMWKICKAQKIGQVFDPEVDIC